MSKGGFRRIDVDQYDEEKFKEDQCDQGGNGPDEGSVNNELMSGNAAQALKIVLQNPPYRNKNAQVKDQVASVVLRVLSSFKTSEINPAIQNLNDEELDILMKYIYKGFALGSDGQSCGTLLTWHEKVVAKAGMGSIVRVLADRKRV